MVKLSKYDELIPDYGAVMTRAEFVDAVKAGSFIDYDGHGHPAKGGRMASKIDVIPSFIGTGKSEPSKNFLNHIVSDLPPEATHIVWFNK
jgi:hypothetical protein